MKGCLLLICVVVLAQTAHGLVGEKTVTVSKLITRFDTFNYQKGGSFSLSFRAKDFLKYPGYKYNLLFYGCTDQEYETFMVDSQYTGLASDCQRNFANPAKCLMSTSLGNRTSIELTAPLQARYRFTLVYCTPDLSPTHSMQVQLKYLALNPGHQHLPLGDEPLPTFYSCLLIVWFVVIGVFLVFLKRAPEDTSNALHFALMSVVLCKTLVVILATLYWGLFAKYGIRTELLIYLRRFAFAFSETGFFGTLLLISKGWHVTRHSLPFGELRTLIWALCLLLATLLFFSFYSDDYYFLSLMIMYFFMLPKIFSSITKNIRKLETQTWIGANLALPGIPMYPLRRKSAMFKTLRTAVVAYLGSILLINSMRIIMAWHLDWINSVVSELVALIIISVIVFILRPSDNGVFTNVVEMAALVNLQNWLERARSMNNAEIAQIQPWDISSTIVVEWPSTRSLLPVEKDENGKPDPEELSRRSLALAVEQGYDNSQRLESSKIKRTSAE